jgi:hypothetical protein
LAEAVGCFFNNAHLMNSLSVAALSQRAARLR